MTITKKFVQEHHATDCEARHWDWVDTDRTYDEAVDKLKEKWDGWFDSVRLVEKTFNSDTFDITTKVIKTTKRVYDKYCWTGAVREEKN